MGVQMPRILLAPSYYFGAVWPPRSVSLKESFEPFFFFYPMMSISLLLFSLFSEEEVMRTTAVDGSRLHIAHYITSIPISRDVTACMNVCVPA